MIVFLWLPKLLFVHLTTCLCYLTNVVAENDAPNNTMPTPMDFRNSLYQAVGLANSTVIMPEEGNCSTTII